MTTVPLTFRWIMKIKAFICAALSAALIFSFSSFAFASDGVKTSVYLNYGKVLITADGISGFDENGNAISVFDPDGYRIRQQNNSYSTENNIEVDCADADIELDGVNIDCSDLFGTAAFMIDGESNVSLTVKRNNYLTGGDARASLEVGSSASLTIDGDGSLNVVSVSSGAAIGGGGSNTNGSITINSARITADSSASTSGAGIGGGCNAAGGIITINGGWVNALGGEYSAGIGGGGTAAAGGTVTINGGTVTAVGGIYGAGIGGGRLGKCEKVAINGGSVKATAGENAPNNFGGGYARPAAAIVDSDSNALVCAVVDVNALNCSVDSRINSKTVNVNYTHPDDSNFYFWLKEGTYTADVFPQGGAGIHAQIEISGSTATVTTSSFETLVLKSDSELALGNKLLTGDFSTVTDIKSEFENEILTLFDSDSDQIESFNYFATGQRIALISDEMMIDYADIVISGDLDGDGICDGRDAVIAQAIKSGMLTTAAPSVNAAADADSDGDFSDNDILMIQQKGLLK